MLSNRELIEKLLFESTDPDILRLAKLADEWVELKEFLLRQDTSVIDTQKTPEENIHSVLNELEYLQGEVDRLQVENVDLKNQFSTYTVEDLLRKSRLERVYVEQTLKQTEILLQTERAAHNRTQEKLKVVNILKTNY